MSLEQHTGYRTDINERLYSGNDELSVTDDSMIDITKSFIDSLSHPAFLIKGSTNKICHVNNAAIDHDQDLLIGSAFEEVVQYWNELIPGAAIAFYQNQWYKLSEKALDADKESYKIVELMPREDTPDTESLETWRNMVAIMLHRSRSPLTGITGYLDMIRDKNEDQDIENKFERVQSGFDRLFDMMDELEVLHNTSAQYDGLKASLTNIEYIIQGVVLSYPKEIQNRISYRIPEEGAEVNCDPTNLQRILKILIKNALENSPEGEIKISFTNNGVKALEVSNKGKAIPEEISQKLFYPFITSKTINLGIGLTLAHLYVQQSGGAIFLKNNQDDNITFKVCYPSL